MQSRGLALCRAVRHWVSPQRTFLLEPSIQRFIAPTTSPEHAAVERASHAHPIKVCDNHPSIRQHLDRLMPSAQHHSTTSGQATKTSRLECIASPATVWHAGLTSVTRSVQLPTATRPLSQCVHTSAVHGGKDETNRRAEVRGPHEIMDGHRGTCDGDVGGDDDDGDNDDDVDVEHADDDNTGDEDFAVLDGEYGNQVAQVVVGLDRYRQLFGLTHVPTNFRVPESQEWPRELHGYALGLAVASLRHIANSDGLPEKAEAALDRVGMVWDVYDWRWKHVILPALRRWAETSSTLEPPLYGDEFVYTDAPTPTRVLVGRYWQTIQRRDPRVPVWVYAEVDAIGFKQDRPSSSWHKSRTPEFKNRLLEQMSAKERQRLERDTQRRRERVACPACGKNLTRASLDRHMRQYCPEPHSERHAQRQRLRKSARLE